MIIGITGKAGAGKTTAALALVEQLGFIRRPLAYALKLDVADIARDRYGLDVPVSESGAVAWVDDNKVLLRGVLQSVGTDLVRGLVDTDYWVNRLILDIEKIRDAAYSYSLHGDAGGPGFVVDDVRFVNEADAIIRAGGVVIKLEAPDVIRQVRLGLENGAFEAMNSHVSETGVDAIEATVTIDSSVTAAELQEETVRVVRQLVKALS